MRILAFLLVASGAWAGDFIMPGMRAHGRPSPQTSLIAPAGSLTQQTWAWNTTTKKWVLMQLNTTDFSFNYTTQVGALGANVTELGSCIGESTDFCNQGAGGVNMGGTPTQLQEGTAPSASDCNASGHAGRIFMDTDGPVGAKEYICPGSTGWEPQGGRPYLLGGDGSDGAFTWNGTTGCSQGTISSTTCILPANSLLGRSFSDPVVSAVPTLYSCVYNFTTFSLTGGTLVCDSASPYSATANTSPIFGGMFVIRSQQSPTITGGTVDCTGHGMTGGAGGNSGTTGNRASGAGGPNSFVPGGAGGAAGKNAGTVGPAALATPVLNPMRWLLLQGTGGGGGAGSNSGGGNAAGVQGTGLFEGKDDVYAGSGGGGGACQTGTASNTGGPGGRGGGGFMFETAQTWACSGATFLTSGMQPAAGTLGGGGGGGAGSVERVYRDLGTDTCTYTMTGGAAGTSTDSTNCAVAAAGGAGAKYGHRMPR